MKSAKSFCAFVLMFVIALASATCAFALAPAAAGAEEERGYLLQELPAESTVSIDAAETPLAAAPQATEECCVLHLVFLLAALCVLVVYVQRRKAAQARRFALLCSMLE